MNCPECGSKAKIKTNKVKNPGGITSLPSIVEFIAVVIAILAFIYAPLQEHKAILLVSAFVLALIGHGLSYSKVMVLKCKSCKKEFPINT